MTARTPSQRARDSLEARQRAGYRVVRVFLSPAAAAALDSLTRDGATMTAAIERALLDSHAAAAASQAG